MFQTVHVLYQVRETTPHIILGYNIKVKNSPWADQYIMRFKCKYSTEISGDNNWKIFPQNKHVLNCMTNV
jgi:hypothetical protein